MNKILLVCISVLFIITCPAITAYDFDVNVNIPKKEYIVGETVLTEVRITSGNLPFSGTVKLDIALPKETKYYGFEPFAEDFDLSAGETKEFIFPEYISEINPSGIYIATVTILDESGEILDIREILFSVSGTKEIFTLDLFICKDQACTKESKVFLKNEDMYINYNSEIRGILIESRLVYPDKTTQQLTLPTQIKAEQIGTYTLEVTASKQGYKTITKKEQFAVIEKHAEIPLVKACNMDNTCNDNENHQTCPQDCLSGEKDGYCDKVSDGKCDPDCKTGDSDCKPIGSLLKNKKILLFLSFFLVFIIILIFFLKHKKNVKPTSLLY